MGMLIDDKSFRCSNCNCNLFIKNQYVAREYKDNGSLNESYSVYLYNCIKCGELNGPEADVELIKRSMK